MFNTIFRVLEQQIADGTVRFYPQQTMVAGQPPSNTDKLIWSNMLKGNYAVEWKDTLEQANQVIADHIKHCRYSATISTKYHDYPEQLLVDFNLFPQEDNCKDPDFN